MASLDYLHVAAAHDLHGRDRLWYRLFEILPALLAWGTLLGLTLLAWFQPVWVAFFVIAFDIYWLLLVLFLGIHLVAAYRAMKRNVRINWQEVVSQLDGWRNLTHLVILPVYQESEAIVRGALDSLLNDGFPPQQMVVVLTLEERGGAAAVARSRAVAKEYEHRFGELYVTVHPDGLAGELKGKGANQRWGAQQVKKEKIDPAGIPYDSIVVSVFDIDTVVEPGYFWRLTHAFLTVPDRYRASYQPIPVYNNNLWDAPFFARVAATSNTFWQMMQQIRAEKLATYSSHSMSWRALVDIGFWAPNMVSEDSRIFWHCYLYYNGHYRVEPLYYPVSMDVCMDKTSFKTAANLYKQQRRWGWGVENLPYLLFNAMKRWRAMPKGNLTGRIFTQIYGFHSWATNALIIAVIGWLPLFIGGQDFNATVLSGNLPVITRTLMTLAMAGLVLSAIVSMLLLPKRAGGFRPAHYVTMFVQWIILPISIIIFGSIPALESQTRLALGGKWRLGFWVTPKER